MQVTEAGMRMTEGELMSGWTEPKSSPIGHAVPHRPQALRPQLSDTCGRSGLHAPGPAIG